ncbi:unnamed protein product [Protopolystoma xenopodis]|uniref:Uncharacterized protein n=1 Tax=Protopolystoma xenopodis TaxID=117903 RepID=A0A3S5AFD0_9PLAT|nr:unnamed protein product [Protopolystoma xenopodis]
MHIRQIEAYFLLVYMFPLVVSSILPVANPIRVTEASFVNPINAVKFAGGTERNENLRDQGDRVYEIRRNLSCRPSKMSVLYACRQRDGRVRNH